MKREIFKWLSIFVMTVVFVGFMSCDGDNPEPQPQPIPVNITEETPLTLEAIGSGTITFKNRAAGKVTYRVDDGVEQTIAAGADENISVNAGQQVKFFGDNTTYCADWFKKSNISGTADFYAYGNIMSLITSTNYSTAKTLKGDFTFEELFKGATHLRNHPSKSLVLPATILTMECYSGMFSGCTGLTKAPELPARTLAKRCYSSMFSGCTNLTDAPTLPATIMTSYCCAGMFENCTSLTTAPVLPATTLDMCCYFGMFKGCVNLTTAPALPATKLAEGCYQEMFNDCRGLTKAPALPATTLVDYCYREMFYGCSSLTNAPTLPATTLARSCYTYMFYGCSSLINAPVLPAKTFVSNCYTAMFENCTNLNYVQCLASDYGEEQSFADAVKYNCGSWLEGVGSSGKFLKASGVKWPKGESGIPNGWTIINADNGEEEQPDVEIKLIKATYTTLTFKVNITSEVGSYECKILSDSRKYSTSKEVSFYNLTPGKKYKFVVTPYDNSGKKGTEIIEEVSTLTIPYDNYILYRDKVYPVTTIDLYTRRGNSGTGTGANTKYLRFNTSYGHIMQITYSVHEWEGISSVWASGTYKIEDVGGDYYTYVGVFSDPDRSRVEGLPGKLKVNRSSNNYIFDFTGECLYELFMMHAEGN